MEIKTTSLHQSLLDETPSLNSVCISSIYKSTSTPSRQRLAHRFKMGSARNEYKPDQKSMLHDTARKGRGTRSPIRCVPWINISLAFCAIDAVVSSLVGRIAFAHEQVGGVNTICLAPLILSPLLTVALLYERGFYSRSAVLRSASMVRLITTWLQACGLLMAAAAILQVAFTWKQVPGANIEITSRDYSLQIIGLLAGGAAALLAPRIIWSAARRRLTGPFMIVHGRAVIAGTNEAIREAIGLTHAFHDEFDIIGIIKDEEAGDLFEQSLSIPVLGSLDDLTGVVRRNSVDTVIVAIPAKEQAKIADVFAQASRLPVSLRLLLDGAVGSFLRQQSPIHGSGHHFLTIRDAPLSGFNAVAKRTEDIVLSALLLLALSPLLIIIGIAIKLDTPGPVLFRQPRQGFNGKLFELTKFRSMQVSMADLTSQQQTTRADPRLTRVGALLRRHSLDELPQLFNVLRGEMSIVGPRPHALGTRAKGLLLDEVVEAYVARCQVKPGITGWAQVNGWRGELNTLEKLERRVEHDVDYIENWSMILDFKILARTVGCVFHDANAY